MTLTFYLDKLNLRMKYLPNKCKSTSRDNSGISGQALLLVLLGMAVVLTLVLSVVSRSMTDVSLTTRDEESLRAFSAAEAGIERLIVSGSPGETVTAPLNTGSYEGVVNLYGIGEEEVSYPEIKSGESITIWFVEHDDNGEMICGGGKCFLGDEINVYWGDDGTPTDESAPAIEITLFYDNIPGRALVGDYSNVRVARAAYDVVASRTNSNSFTLATGGKQTIGDNAKYEFSTGDIDDLTNGICAGVEGCLLFAKVKMFYNGDVAHGVGVKVDSPLPSQGRSIESTGTSGDATAKVVAFQSFSEPLDIFESALFSTSGLVKTEN